MRDLSSSDRNELEVFDGRSGSNITLYYRTPTSKEEVLYQKRIIKKQGRKIVLKVRETRIDFGLRLITGFKEGDFGVDGNAISADPESALYREDWKELLEKYASDIISIMATVIFEGVKSEGAFDSIEDGDTEEADDEEVVLEKAVPLETNSGAS